METSRKTVPPSELKYVPQAWEEVTFPIALEMHVASPRSIHGHENIVRMWFPEVIEASYLDGKVWVWNTFFLQKAEWKREKNTLKSVDNINDIALMTRTVTWHGDQLEFELKLKNTSPRSWSCNFVHICLQMSAAPDYADDKGDRTYLMANGDFTPTSKMAITDGTTDTRHGLGKLGVDIPMVDGSKRRVTEGVFFVVSRDKRYVLGYSWQPPEMFAYGRRGVVSCIHMYPTIRNVEPQKEGLAKGLLFLMEGTLEDASKRYKTWQTSLNI